MFIKFKLIKLIFFSKPPLVIEYKLNYYFEYFQQTVLATILMVAIMYLILPWSLWLGVSRKSRILLVGYILIDTLQLMVEFGLMLYMIKHRHMNIMLTKMSIALGCWISKPQFPLKYFSEIQFLSRSGILFGPNIVPPSSKYFAPYMDNK